MHACKPPQVLARQEVAAITLRFFACLRPSCHLPSAATLRCCSGSRQRIQDFLQAAQARRQYHQLHRHQEKGTCKISHASETLHVLFHERRLRPRRYPCYSAAPFAGPGLPLSPPPFVGATREASDALRKYLCLFALRGKSLPPASAGDADRGRWTTGQHRDQLGPSSSQKHSAGKAPAL